MRKENHKLSFFHVKYIGFVDKTDDKVEMRIDSLPENMKSFMFSSKLFRIQLMRLTDAVERVAVVFANR